ncbi:MAG: hypothetical protein R3F60_19085 [bacterium]
MAGLGYDGWVRGEGPPPDARPRAGASFSHTSRGWWRGGAQSCAPDDRQGRYTWVPPTACDGEAEPLAVVVDRCGAVLLSRARRRSAGPGRATPSRRGGPGPGRRPPHPRADAGAAPPGDLAGDFHRVEIWRERRTVAPDGGPGTVTEDRILLEAGEPEKGPFARLTEAGRLLVATRRLSLEGRLLGFDGEVLSLEGEPGPCGAQARLAGASPRACSPSRRGCRRAEVRALPTRSG